MAHQKLLMAMVGLFVLAAGGIFALMNQSGEELKWTEVDSSSLVAGLTFEGEEEADPAEGARELTDQKRIASAAQNSLSGALSQGEKESAPSPAVQPQVPPSPKVSASQSKININTAGSEDLRRITGVGPVTAQRILDWRAANGLFYEIEDIKQVSGIGDATFEKMKNEITVGDVPPRPAPEAAEQEDAQVLKEPIAEKEPEKASQPPPPPLPPSTPEVSFPININTADRETLQHVTGIGLVIAQRIIDYRQDVSLFYYIEDIKNVNGIGDATFEKMKGQITVGDIVAPSPIPSPTPQPLPSPPPSPEPSKININTADYEELQEITGVGPVIARRIVNYREANGPFQSSEDIKLVNGIGEATFEKMKSEITI